MGSVNVVKKYLVFGKLLFLLILYAELVQAEISINEIMYNPTYSDSYNEWIEIYNNNEFPINLTNWKICNDNLLSGYIDKNDGQTYLENNLIIQADSYAIITDGGTGTEAYSNFNINDNAIALHVEGSSICSGLSNSYEVITLSNDSIIDAISYHNLWGADGNNNSLCKIPNEEGLWQECTISPGSSNSIQELEYEIIINEFLPDPEGYDDAPIPNGEWIELFNQGSQEVDLEGFVINDNYGNGLSISNTNTIGTTIIEPNSFLVIYRNQDGKLELNNDGDKITLYNPSNNIIDEVSYSTSREQLSWSRIDDEWLLTIPSPDQENIYEEIANDSEIKIEKIYLGSDDIASFGDIIRVKLEIFKGETNKYSVEAYIINNEEKVSKTTNANLFDKFTNYVITLPIQILPNCDLKYQDGTYQVRVEGLDAEDDKDIEIKGISDSLCQEIEVEKECKSEKKDCPSRISLTSYKDENNINSSTTALIYESPSTKSRNIASYLFNALLILTIIAIIKWKR